MSVLEKIKELEAQKTKLLADAKAEALKAAEAAVSTLNELGFHYRLLEGGSVTPSVAAPTGKRRTGVRDEVLSTIKRFPNGISRGDLLEELHVKGDKSGEQSVSNAVSNLKKAGKITGEEGMYKVAS